MSWQDEMVPLLRVFVNDTDEAAQRFTDDRLEAALVGAAYLVLGQLDFPVDYTPDIAGVDITPDPTAAGTRDDNFINLVAVHAACLTDRGAAALAADQAIMVQDGTSKVDLRDAFKAKLALLRQGWCAVYQDMVAEYRTGQQGLFVGAAIMTPFRLSAGCGADRPFLTGDGGRRYR